MCKSGTQEGALLPTGLLAQSDMPWVDFFGTGWLSCLQQGSCAKPCVMASHTHCLEVPVVVALHKDVKPAHACSRQRVRAFARWVQLMGQGLPLLLMLCVFVCCWGTLSAHTLTTWCRRSAC